MTDVLVRAGRGLAGTYPALGYPAYRLYWGSSVVSLVMNTLPLAGLQAGALATAFSATLSLAFNGAVVGVAGVAAAVFVPRLRRV